MRALQLSMVAPVLLLLAGAAAAAAARGADPRVREVEDDGRSVIEVAVKRGTVLHIALDSDEAISDVASGLSSDCARAEAPWCIAAQAGSRHLFVKAKSTSNASNNLAVVTDHRIHAFRFVVLENSDPRAGAYQLTVKSPPRQAAAAAASAAPLPVADAPMLLAPSPAEIVAGRLTASPTVVNSTYSIAEGKASIDIVPTLVFDDGRFTYFRFPNNREVPAVFHVLGDGSETLVNTRMEGDLLVVDRVARQLMLRAGQAVVGVWNEAFDVDGKAPVGGTTIDGVVRHTRPAP